MKSTRVAVWRLVVSCLIALCGMTYPAFADELATITGRITDPQGLVVGGVKVEATNINTNIIYSGDSNADGLYRIPSIPPGAYRVNVQKTGFVQILKPGVELHVQDIITLNFTMQLGSVSQTITVEGGAPLINTESAAVSTLVDRQFAENLPMNGRSFQTLIQLTPGVVLTVSNNADNGQFSVNGQRSASNYWMVDGVSANIGVSSTNQTGNGLSGAAASFSVLGGTNSLVSVDALQEFRIQTSTYAPEFGRTPGGQITIVTRAGANQWHGSAFDYLRNDIFDANDWFANKNKLSKPEERQNDFGGTFSGPILKERTFFFFSYEGLRLRLPQVVESPVPDRAARQNAVPGTQPVLNAFPLPTPGAPDDVTTGIGIFDASYSNAATLDAYSLRVDHKLSDKFSLFGRYNYSPSSLVQRGVLNSNLSTVVPGNITTQTATVGATWTISPVIVNDLRFNYSRTSGNSHSYLDSFGGAVPLTSLPFPSPFTSQTGAFQFLAFSLFNGLNVGPQGDNLQRQINVVDSLSAERGSHSLKFGVDFRRLSPVYRNPLYQQEVLFFDVPSEVAGSPFLSIISSSRNATLLFRNLGLFAQDTWRVIPRLTLTYGLRWDVDFAASSNPAFAAVTGFDANDFSKLALAPAGTPPYNTTYGSIAPRIGVAYQLSQSQDWKTVLRGGFGLFYDLASSEAGNLVFFNRYPFGASNFVFGGNFPLSPTASAPPPITLGSIASGIGALFTFAPNLKLPYTFQWSLALEQSLGKQQTLTASYIGSAGRRLIQTADVDVSNPVFPFANLVMNAAMSDYNAFQLQFQRRLSHGVQALASYTWSHSIDTASAGSLIGNAANASLPGIVNSNRGPSDFDIRNTFSAGITYDIRVRRFNLFTDAILRGWSTDNFITARSALPITVYDGAFFLLKNDIAQVRPDVVPGIPLYLYGSQYPGGKAINNTLGAVVGGCPDGSKSIGPFCPPPSANFAPLRQGNLGRNTLRGFGAAQWDFAVHREFPIHESLKLQFRAEMFNVLNHPNFAPPISNISNQTQFGLSNQSLGQYLGGGNVGRGGFSSLYQTGGPRSIQFALKLQF